MEKLLHCQNRDHTVNWRNYQQFGILMSLPLEPPHFSSNKLFM
jgi:hypothetical protein